MGQTLNNPPADKRPTPHTDTIAAIATPWGEGGLAVVRVSGPDALAVAGRLWKGMSLLECGSHSAHFGRIAGPDGCDVDECVATIFRAPHSYTGEDTVELSIHGSRWIQKEVLRLLAEAGARPAGPGEFTQRAFLNGRLDMAQAEGVADLIAASSRSARELAMRQVSGSYSRGIAEMRQGLLELAALLELELDFSEEDIEFADRTRLKELLEKSISKIEATAGSYRSGKAIKEGIPVAIAGLPNSGKSTLLNAILGEDKAIVSDIPGTTRDVIEDTREIGGALFRFSDTAGLRDTDDPVESIGINRARQAISRASVLLWVIDSTLGPGHARNQLSELARYQGQVPRLIALLNKTDLCESYPPATDSETLPAGITVLPVSCKQGLGLNQLEKELTETAGALLNSGGGDGGVVLTNARHHDLLLKSLPPLRRVRRGLDTALPADLLAQDLREALAHLAAITGPFATPDLLTHIFAHFCIGK